MKILVIDNYDSFTYNLVHLVQSITKTNVDVLRNDEFEIESIKKYDKIILSPGPGIPSEAGKLKEAIQTYASTKSVLGVCLGLQAITEVFGGKLKNLSEVYHGVSTNIKIKNSREQIFKNLPETIQAGRYHSWIIDKNTLPDCFNITAEDDVGNIMALSHKIFDVKGVQFHPESVLTEFGEQIMRNWLNHSELFELNLPTAGNNAFHLNSIKSGLLFC